MEKLPEDHYQVIQERFQRNERGVVEYLLEQEPRFKDFSEVKTESAMPRDGVRCLVEGKMKTHWRGVSVLKEALVLAIYQHLIFELKPGTVFDIGTYAGGSALWFHDIARAMGLSPKVVTVDISMENVASSVKDHAGITFVEADISKPEAALPKDLLLECPHPWLVTEDCHVATLNLWKYLDPHM